MWSHDNPAMIAEVSIKLIKPGKNKALSSKTASREIPERHGGFLAGMMVSTRPGQLSHNELEHHHVSWEKYGKNHYFNGHCHITMEHRHVEWEKTLFQWPCL